MALVLIDCPACGSSIEIDLEETAEGYVNFRKFQYSCQCPLVGRDAEKLLRDAIDAAREGWGFDFVSLPGLNEHRQRLAEESEARFAGLSHSPFSEEELRVLDRWRAVVENRDGLARVRRIVPSPDEAPGLVALTQRGFVRMVESHGAIPVYQVLAPGMRWQDGVANEYRRTLDVG